MVILRSVMAMDDIYILQMGFLPPLPVSDFSGLVVSMLASGTQVRGFKPG
jgi:hypothetical protein